MHMSKGKRPLVAVLMGSDSDLPTMQETGKMLDKFLNRVAECQVQIDRCRGAPLDYFQYLAL